MKNSINLPSPDSNALKHSEKVAQHIQREINKTGSISFAHFMELALYAPGLGYYAAGLKKLGKEGDFVTAPEISPIFSHCIAAQCQQVLSHIPESAILEIGAGKGTMAVDILLELERLHALPHHYYILDVSADLLERQQQLFEQKIPHLLPKISWLSSLEHFSFSGVVLANEVLDAMPVQRFSLRNNELMQYYVTGETEFRWLLKKPEPEVSSAIEKLEWEFPANYDTEINLMFSGWLATIDRILNKGLLLISDYGFPRPELYHPDRSCGTLMCHYRHHAHDNPLILPGIQDITAHVDFSAIAEAAIAANFSLSGYTNQSQFLMSCGITDKLSDITDIGLLSKIKVLLMPSEMGEIFKFIALTKNWDDALLGFKLKDFRDKL